MPPGTQEHTDRLFARHQPDCAVHAEAKDWQERQRGRAVPRVEVTVTEIGEEAGEADRAAHEQRPPGPHFAVAQRKLGEPQVQHTNSQDRATERDSIVDHEMREPRVGDRVQGFGRHAEELDVVRQEVTGRAQEEREQAGADQRDPGELQERAAVGDESREEPASIVCWV